MRWVDICPLDRITCDRGVAARVGDDSVAVFRLTGDEMFAIDHVDPCTGIAVLARGLIGSVGNTPTVASPIYKERFDLRTGVCIDDPQRTVRTWPVRIFAGRVEVGIGDAD